MVVIPVGLLLVMAHGNTVSGPSPGDQQAKMRRGREETVRFGAVISSLRLLFRSVA